MEQDNWYLTPGDLIEIDRRFYQHWALYMGDGYVIHVTDVGSKDAFMSVGASSNITGKAKVKKELLKEVVGNDKWRVNNKYDHSCTPLPVKEIIRRAERWIDREVPYDVLGSNCEHFVTELRYGEGVSGQVAAALIDITKAALGNIFVYAASTVLGIPAVVVTGILGYAARVAGKALSKSTSGT